MSVRLGLSLALLGCLAASAQARNVNAPYRHHVAKGVFELGFDNFLLFRSNKATPPDSDDSITSTDIVWTGGLTPRYFLMKNLSVGANLNFFTESLTQTLEGAVESETTTADSGFLGVALINYYVHLAGGMFFKPGLGGGYMIGTRSIPDPTDATKKIESSISAVVAKVDLGLAYYATQRFSLRAGPELLMRFGQETKDDDAMTEGPSFTRIDATFGVGVGYVF